MRDVYQVCIVSCLSPGGFHRAAPHGSGAALHRLSVFGAVCKYIVEAEIPE